MGSGTLAPWVRMTGQWGIGATVGCGLPVVGNGKFRSRRRAQRERRRGPVAPTLIDLVFLAGSDLLESVHQVVRAPYGVDVAVLGLGINGRVRLHIGKQEHGDDEEAGVSRDIGTFSRRDMAASQARRLRGASPRGRPALRDTAGPSSGLPDSLDLQEEVAHTRQR